MEEREKEREKEKERGVKGRREKNDGEAKRMWRKGEIDAREKGRKTETKKERQKCVRKIKDRHSQAFRSKEQERTRIKQKQTQNNEKATTTTKSREIGSERKASRRSAWEAGRC